MGWPRSRWDCVLGSTSLAGLGWCTILSGWALSQGTERGSVGDDALGSQHQTSRRACIVLGAAGEPEYGAKFRSWSQEWRVVFGKDEVTWLGEEESAGDGSAVKSDAGSGQVAPPKGSVVPQGVVNDRDAVLEWVSKGGAETDEHWLILIGHGTHDAKSTKFNLVGPDLSAEDLVQALSGKSGKWIVLVCASCSGPFLAKLGGPNRIVITATKSGAEQNFSRFGQYLAESSHDASSDLDHDQAVSVLEMFLAASDRVSRYYADQGLLATEQSLIDDNGDGKGTPATFYRGVRAVKSAAGEASLDGGLARRTMVWQNGPMDGLSPTDLEQMEKELERLRGLKSTMDLDAYYLALERLFRQYGHQDQRTEKPTVDR